MSFVRPEVRAALSRWREALIGVLIICLGLYWSSGVGILKWVGVVIALGGAILTFTGLQRARFRADGGGPGVVTVDEGEISYFGPFNGGSISIRELAMLSLDPRSKPPVWVLSQAGQGDLYIPVNAEGADRLFDAFAALPGIRTDHLLTTLNKGADDVVVIWAKRPRALH
jgi:hypothetical protein